jgi:hypothetical protein
MRSLLVLALLLFGGCSKKDDNKDDETASGIEDGKDNPIDGGEDDGYKPDDVTPVDQLEDNPPETPAVSSEKVMESGKSYKLFKGDKVVDLGDAQLKIVRNSENSYTEVELLSGEAKVVWAGE